MFTSYYIAFRLTYSSYYGALNFITIKKVLLFPKKNLTTENLIFLRIINLIKRE